jgi:endoglucanase
MKPRMPITPSARLVGALLCACLLAAAGVLAQATQASTTKRAVAVTSGAPDLHVSAGGLFTAHGRRVVLHGVNRAGGEFACVKGHGFWDGPMDQASVTAMKSWHVNAVRVPLNEACWNGESYVPLQDRGPHYRRAVEAYVQLLNRNAIVAILDLHFTDGLYTGPHAQDSGGCPDTAEAVCQKPMPDAAQSIPFWTSVARTFKANDAVIFDVFNEAFPERTAGGSEAEGWRCWLRGGSFCAGIDGYRAAGMQSLVTAIRSTGARNVILLGGLRYADDLTGWLRHVPRDPDHNLAASWHLYPWNLCNAQSCWNRQVAPVIAKVPVVVDEFGVASCSATFINPLMRWLDARSTGYLAWAWNARWPCAGGPGKGPSLITSYSGSPTAYGAGYESHLRSLK